MVAEPYARVDVEAAVREWARDALPAVDRRVFFGFNKDAALPQIVLFRIGGPDAACLIQFDVWGQSKASAEALASDLESVADELSRFAFNGALLLGAVVEGGRRWEPDEDTDMPRYIVDMMFTAVAGEASSS